MVTLKNRAGLATVSRDSCESGLSLSVTLTISVRSEVLSIERAPQFQSYSVNSIIVTSLVPTDDIYVRSSILITSAAVYSFDISSQSANCLSLALDSSSESQAK